MTSSSDPRVFIASERTLLAWLRTGIAVIGLGFLVARFGFFLAIVSGREGYRYQPISTAIGVGLVLVGTLMIGIAAWQQRRFVKSLAASDLPAGYSTRLSIWLATLLASAGLVLAIYLSVSTEAPRAGMPETVPANNAFRVVDSSLQPRLFRSEKKGSQRQRPRSSSKSSENGLKNVTIGTTEVSLESGD